MPQIIPAAPGWYLEETDDGETTLDPVIAWKVATAADGEDILLPFVDAGPCAPPFAHTEESFESFRRQIVYRPSYDPATEGDDR
ncbi:hypothetical protein [Streptomyces sp. IBSBF 2435]|uniref:hypothetical protein n=1 Tax=Streptomyces sp. IBSBF 2435 TaxID=2903531 RepID=UPI002FDC2245